jgi:hypothetical protein
LHGLNVELQDEPRYRMSDQKRGSCVPPHLADGKRDPLLQTQARFTVLDSRRGVCVMIVVVPALLLIAAVLGVLTPRAAAMRA